MSGSGRSPEQLHRPLLDKSNTLDAHTPPLLHGSTLDVPVARRQKTLTQSALAAALILASGDTIGEEPADWSTKSTKGSQLGEEKRFRLLDRDAPLRQSLGKSTIKRVNRDQELFLMDPFHVIIEMSLWRLLVSFWVLYCITFSIFAFIYWMASHKCGIGCDTYIQALFLSVETMLTIGYGVPDPYFKPCHWLVAVLIVQCLIAVIYDAVFVGVVYQRISRGTTRASTILFSDKAVIRSVGDATFLMFRICEMRRTQLLNSKVRCYLFTRQRWRTKEQGCIFWQDPMRLEQPDDSLGGHALLILPLLVVHRVDGFSPLLGRSTAPLHQPLDAMSQQAGLAPLQRASDAEAGCRDGTWCRVCGASYPSYLQLRRHIEYTAEQEAREACADTPHAALLESWEDGPTEEDIRTRLMERMDTYDLEVVCILEGVDAITSSSVQVRHSYMVDDIDWDSHFAPCVSAAGINQVQIDFATFHDLEYCP